MYIQSIYEVLINLFINSKIVKLLNLKTVAKGTKKVLLKSVKNKILILDTRLLDVLNVSRKDKYLTCKKCRER